MEYERIDKLQTGVISPTKLRLRLLAGNLNRRIGGGNNSSRTSPAKIADMEIAKNGLLDTDDAFLDEGNLKEPASSTCFNMPSSVRKLVSSGQDDQGGRKHHKEFNPNGKDGTNHLKFQDNCKNASHQLQVGNTNAVHPARILEEFTGEYDAKMDNMNSAFEFHRGERILPNPVLGPFSRPPPSKWDDAEKWIINRQKSLPNAMKNCDMLDQLNRPKVGNWVRVAPEAVIPEARAAYLQAMDSKRPNLHHISSQDLLEKFPCVTTRSLPCTKGPDATSIVVDQKEVHEVEVPLHDSGIPQAKSICMRDMGTEMTPGPSQEPSRMGTPVGATTPIRSFNSSRDSTPIRGSPTPTPVKSSTGRSENGTVSGLSKDEFQLKTRREIVALGVKLGKMNIAAWASKDDLQDACSSHKPLDALDKAAFEARASSWEEAEKSKYMARFRRKEVSIQAWESQQKVKYEAKLREVEVQLERKRAAAQEKIMRKLASTKQKCEQRLSAAEARKSRQSTRTARQAEIMRRTGSRSSHHLLCCSMFF